MKFEIINSNPFRRHIALVFFVCFLGSFIIHLTAVFGHNLIRYELINFIIHGGMLIPFFLMIRSFQKEFNLYKLTEEDNENSYWKCFFLPMPKWVKYVFYFTFCYAILNFFLLLPYVSQFKTAIVNEKYVLVPIKSGNPPQTIVREITKDEYEQQNSYNTRHISGHWMLFYLIPALFFWFERPKSKWVSVD